LRQASRVGSDRGLRGGGIGRDGLRLLDGDIGRRLKCRRKPVLGRGRRPLCACAEDARSGRDPDVL